MSLSTGHTERTCFINSRDRASGSSTSFNVFLNRAVFTNDISRIILKRISIPNLFYNVPTRKATLYLLYNGAPSIVTVTPGQYDATAFMAVLNAALQTQVDPSFVAVLNFDTGKVTITCDTPFTVLSHQSVQAEYKVDDSMNDVVGSAFNAEEPSALSWTCPGIIDLTGEKLIRIESGALAFSNSIDSNGSIFNCLEAVSVHEPYGATIHYSPSDHIMSYVDGGSAGRQLTNVDITLRADSGAVLELPSNAYIEVVLLFLFTTE